MRLFVAVELPEQVRGHLEAATEAMRGGMDGWRWTPTGQWHLTLAFLGEVSEDRLDELSRRMGLAARRHRPFALDLRGLGAFNSPRRARVLWVGVGGDRDALTRLADSVSAGARRAKIPLQERRYRPHMTLGRSRTPVDVREPLESEKAYAGPAWTVGEFSLVRSHLGRVVRHEVLERFPLARR